MYISKYFLLFTLMLILIFKSFGQSIEFRKGDKKLFLDKNFKATFKMKYGKIYTGEIDILTETQITIVEKNKNIQIIIQHYFHHQ